MIYKSYNQSIIRPLVYLTLAVIAATVVTLAYCTFRFNFDIKCESRDPHMSITPMQVQSVKDVRIWEFLSVKDEELVSKSKSSLLSGKSRLTRIYYGTVRYGIDLDNAVPDWVRMDVDTVDVTLPKIQLLDKRFVDEAKTETFYESGSWDATEKESMYVQATRQMVKRCVTTENVRIAQRNALSQFESIFRSMGFMYVRVHF